MKVIIDRSNCVSCGTCWDACPGFFEQNPDDSFSQIIGKFRLEENIAEGIPPEGMEACAVDAVDLCPASVITVEQ
jgi:ferredoxin